MTAKAPEDPRVKTVRSPWRAGAWLSPRAMAWASAASVAALFGTLLFLLKARPLPRPASAGTPPPRLASKISSVQERLKTDPQDISAMVELGTLLFERGKESYVEAIGVLEEARELGALDPRIFYCLGVMYQDEGLFPFALNEYKRFLRHYPEDKEVRLLAAKLYFRLGLFPEAVSEFERLKFQDANDPLIEENLGLSLWRAKQLDRAKASFGQLKTLGGDYARRAEFFLGQMALEESDFQGAYDRFAAAGTEPVPGLDPQTLPTGLAMAAQKLGKWDEAKTAWEAVLRATPDDAKAKQALREAGRRADAARRAAERAAKKK